VSVERPLVDRMSGFGTTIFAEMTALATETGAINLGQGFPDEDGPAEVMEAAIAAIRAGHNQNPPGNGIPELRRAIADHQLHHYGIELDPDREVIDTTGATEGIAASIMALAGPGDEVLTFEPYYDSYAACIALGGATRRTVTLRPPHYRFDPDELEAAVTPATKVLLVNSPHNPTGMVLSRPELEQIASICRRHDLIAVTDEVYEHLTFDDHQHIPLATLPDMFERTLTISSAGKTFSFTGWKVGWLTGPEALVSAARTVKQFLTYTSGGPFQHAIAAALALPDSVVGELRAALSSKRERICAGLTSAGFEVYEPSGTYFVTADIRPLGGADGYEFCRELPARAGVVAVPNQVFYDDVEAGRPLIRFAFCKRDEVIDEACERLAKLGADR
jgi:N-succinyldiaminopimelate aminotransferase